MSRMQDTSGVQKRPPSRWWNVLIAVAAGVLASFVLVPIVQDETRVTVLAEDIAMAREAALGPSDSSHLARRNDLTAIIHIPLPIYSATYDLCYVDGSSSLMIEAYNKNCLLSHVDIYEAPGKNSAVDQAIEDAQTGSTDGRVQVDDYLAAAGVYVSDQERPDLTAYKVWAVRSRASDAHIVADQRIVADSRPLYNVEYRFDGLGLLTETGQTQLDPAKQYLVVNDVRPYFYKVLGCSWAPLGLCGRPPGAR